MHDGKFENVATAILALFPPFAEGEQRVALTLYRLLAEGGAVSGELLARAAQMPSGEVEDMLTRWPGVCRDDEGRVTGYGGLTIAETRHRMQIGRNTRYAWCAWDTLFIPHLLGVSTHVESACPTTGERVTLTVHPDRIEPRGTRPPVSLLAPDPKKAAADIVGHFCCHVQFFAAERAGNEWVAKHPGTLLATLDEAWELGRRHNAQRYPMLRR